MTREIVQGQRGRSLVLDPSNNTEVRVVIVVQLILLFGKP